MSSGSVCAVCGAGSDFWGCENGHSPAERKRDRFGVLLINCGFCGSQNVSSTAHACDGRLLAEREVRPS